MDGATIKSLHVAGSITNQRSGTGGLIGNASGNCTISNCWSSVTITVESQDDNHGGFIGVASGNITIKNCLFDGKLLHEYKANLLCGGFVGSNQGSINFKSCYFKPAEITIGTANSATFAPNGVTSIDHSYYSTTFGEAQGTAVGDMTPAQLVAALNNGLSNWQVDGSGNVVPIMVPGPYDLRDATVEGLKSIYLYDEVNPVEITYTVTDFADNTLEKGTHYTVTLDDVDVTDQTPLTTTALGDHTLIITGKDPYTQSQTFNFTVSDHYPLTASTTEMNNGIYKVTENVETNNRLVVNGEVTLILGAGTELKAINGIQVTAGNTLTIKGEGTLTATAPSEYAAIGNDYGHQQTEYGHIIIESGTVNATGGHNAAGIGGGYGNYDRGNSIIEIKGGIVNATGGTCAAGIGAGQSSSPGTSGDRYAGKPGQIFITGGQVTARGGGNTDKGSGIGGGYNFGDYGRTGTLTLGWTNETDFINTDGIRGFSKSDENNISFVDGKRFRFNETNTLVTSSNLSLYSNYLVPADEHDIALCKFKTKGWYSLYTGANTTIPCTVTTFLGNVLTEGVDYEVKYKKDGTDAEIDKINEKGFYYVIVRGKSPYHGEQITSDLIIDGVTKAARLSSMAVW